MTLLQKQRLIGAVLLLCVILVVAIFLITNANQSDEMVDVVEQIEKPFTSVVDPIAEDDVQTLDYGEETLLDPQNLNEQAEIVVAGDDKSIDQIVDKKDTPPAPAPVVNPSQEMPAWILQLASFTVKDNAELLKSQVNKMGYKTTIESGRNAKGAIYRVRLEPMSDKAAVEKISAELNKKLNLTTQVMQYKPK